VTDPSSKLIDADSWHLNKGTTLTIIGLVLGALFTILSGGLAFAAKVNSLEQSVEILKVGQVNSLERDHRQDLLVSESVGRLEATLTRLESKFDRVIERQADAATANHRRP
jgi:nucleoside-triphosphatase THEP1